MKRATNNFDTKNVTNSSNSFASRTTRSSNTFNRRSITKSGQAWNGDNLTAGAYGAEEFGADPFGVDEFGGIEHFKAVTKPEISH